MSTYSDKDFGPDFQRKIVNLMLRDSFFMNRIAGLIDPSYFIDAGDAVLADIANRYHKKFGNCPSNSTVVRRWVANDVIAKLIDKTTATMALGIANDLDTADISGRDFVIDEVANFARHQAVTNAIMDSVKHLDTGDFSQIMKKITKAVGVGAHTGSSSYDYYAESENRKIEREELATGKRKKNGISTGNKQFDSFFYHGGWGREELSVIMGAAKAGKSMSLADFGKAASLLGYNVIYFTLEVSKKIIADRLDANISDTIMDKLVDQRDDIDGRVSLKKMGGAGKIIIEQFPSGTMKPSDVRRIIERHGNEGVNFDLVIVDYADIMEPENRVDSPTENSKSIYVDLRAIAQLYGFAVLTATQTNREGAKATTAKMTDVAEDFNKVRIADIVLSINSTLDERGAGEARVFFAVSRNSRDGFTVRIRQNRAKMQFMVDIIDVEE